MAALEWNDELEHHSNNVVEISTGKPLIQNSDKVIDLAEERHLRDQRKAATAAQAEAAAVECEGGVCSVTWKPRRPAA